jgi:long-chain acyl-CoA synthetase
MSKQLAFVFCRNDERTLAAYRDAIRAGHAVMLLDANVDSSEIVRRYQGASPIHPDLALLLSTSGSTGSAKFVRLSYAAVDHNAQMIAEVLEIDEYERPILSLPLHYSYGLSVLHSHAVKCADGVLTEEPVTSAAFWDTVRLERCTSLAGVPYTFEVLKRLDLDKLNVPSLKTLTVAGGKLAPELVSHFTEVMARRGGRFIEMYGATEATARIAINGRALPGGHIRIDGGEVVYRGPNVMMGYAEGRADLARGDDLGGELRTGDLGYLDSANRLVITGRIKRIAKVYGLRVNLDEVEAMLGAVAVVEGDDRLLIYCEGDISTDRLRIRHEIRQVEQLPRKANGKVDYAALSRA